MTLPRDSTWSCDTEHVKTGKRMQHTAAFGSGEIDEVDLHIRSLELRARAHEGGGVTRGDGQWPLPPNEVLRADARAAEERRHVVIQGETLRAAPERAGIEM